MTQPPAPITSPKTVDFAKAIERLETRAMKSRRRVTAIFAILFLCACGFAFVLARAASNEDANLRIVGLFPRVSSVDRTSIESHLARRVISIATELAGPAIAEVRSEDRTSAAKNITPFVRPTGEKEAELNRQLDNALEDLANASKITDSQSKEPVSSQVVTGIQRALWTLGSVAFIILVIQISILFIRYHTRLAELYDAQADALRASNGDTDVAFRLMELLSPAGIDFGKTPATLYEKAMETIKTVAEKAKPF